MEPRFILIKPPYLPPLPTYERTMRGVRIRVAVIPVYAAVLVAGRGYLSGSLAAAVSALVFLPAAGLLMWSLTRGRSRVLAEMAGEEPIVFAAEIDGGFELRPSNPRRRSEGLPVFPGDTVRITIGRALSGSWGLVRVRPYMEWRFENGEFRPLVVYTFFDADRALLSDVENRLKALGATAEITHTPYDEAGV